MTPPTFDNPNAKGDKPDKVDADSQHKAGNAVSIVKMSGFEVEAVTFEIAIEFFGPHANGIESDQEPVIGAIGEKKPGFLFASSPVNGQPVGTSSMRSSEFDPTDAERFSRLNRNRTELDPRLPWPADFVFARMA